MWIAYILITCDRGDLPVWSSFLYTITPSSHKRADQRATQMKGHWAKHLTNISHQGHRKQEKSEKLSQSREA